jgi:hypothetical protein
MPGASSNIFTVSFVDGQLEQYDANIRAVSLLLVHELTSIPGEFNSNLTVSFVDECLEFRDAQIKAV